MSALPNPIPPIDTDIPARLDRLPWTRFHWLLVTALGVTWVLDGLEVTVVGSVGPRLTDRATLGLSAQQLGLTHTSYLVGAIAGALLFGYLTDRLGRKKLFTITLLIYLVAALLTALSWDFWSFAAFRFLTGLAIGGEYSAINSAIDELIPARVRGRVDLAVNSTFWLGAMAGSGLSVVLLNPAWVPIGWGWRLAFGLGAVVGLGMIFARRYVPESPRWLLTHGRHAEAAAIMTEIESHVPDPAGLPPVTQRMTIYPTSRIGFGVVAQTLFVKYRRRAILGLVLIASQAFFYNGLNFSFPMVLKQEYGVADESVGVYMLALAAANLLGPMLLGPLFDTIGRRAMIAATYAIAGVAIAVTEAAFLRGALDARTQTACWAGAFFFASAAASAGYLTVSEIFPVEMRGLAIALFYALGTVVGAAAPALFGYLLQTRDPLMLFYGYLGGAGLMVVAAAVEWWLGVDTEGKALEEVAAPITSEGPAPRPDAIRPTSPTGITGR